MSPKSKTTAILDETEHAILKLAAELEADGLPANVAYAEAKATIEYEAAAGEAHFVAVSELEIVPTAWGMQLRRGKDCIVIRPDDYARLMVHLFVAQ